MVRTVHRKTTPLKDHRRRPSLSLPRPEFIVKDADAAVVQQGLPVDAAVGGGGGGGLAAPVHLLLDGLDPPAAAQKAVGAKFLAGAASSRLGPSIPLF